MLPCVEGAIPAPPEWSRWVCSHVWLLRGDRQGTISLRCWHTALQTCSSLPGADVLCSCLSTTGRVVAVVAGLDTQARSVYLLGHLFDHWCIQYLKYISKMSYHSLSQWVLCPQVQCSLCLSNQYSHPAVPWVLDVLQCAGRTFLADWFWSILIINWLILLVSWFKKR